MKENIIIRSATPEDTTKMLHIYTPFVRDTAVTFEVIPPTPDEFRERVLNIQQSFPWLVCMYDGILAGYAYAASHRSRIAYQWTKELSVYIDPDYRKMRIATGLYTSLIEIIKIQGIMTCLAGITLPNLASVAFHEKMGFTKVGVYHKVGYKYGLYRDAGWWELFIQVTGYIPGKIIPVNDIMDGNSWNEAMRRGTEIIRKHP